jgi:hypothetical protein
MKTGELAATVPSFAVQTTLQSELIPNSIQVEKPSRLSNVPRRTISQTKNKDEEILKGVTRSRWAEMCILLAEGIKTNEALERCHIPQTVYRAIMRDDKACQEQVIAARADLDNRNWPEELIEEICVRVASGENQKEIADDLGFKFSAFHALRMRDEYVDKMFEKALKIQAEGLIDEALQIADDDSEDMGQDWKGGDKPNTAAVARSNLKVKHRQWVAQKLLRDRYGDVQKIDMDVNMTVDHAARLEEARKRKEKAFHEKAVN